MPKGKKKAEKADAEKSKPPEPKRNLLEALRDPDIKYSELRLYVSMQGKYRYALTPEQLQEAGEVCDKLNVERPKE